MNRSFCHLCSQRTLVMAMPARSLLVLAMTATFLFVESRGTGAERRLGVLPGQSVRNALTAPKTKASGSEVVLYAFTGAQDGGSPWSDVVLDPTNAIYGTTQSGGMSSGCCGKVFKLTPSASGYSETTAYAFQSGMDGSSPAFEALQLKGGSIYGTTPVGGGGCGSDGCGTVFRLDVARSKYHETVLYRFKGGDDGQRPFGGVVVGNNGVIFGATVQGGGTCDCGTVYELKPSKGAYTEVQLHRFVGTDGSSPIGTLLLAGGSIFGTTDSGGTGQGGTVFELSPKGKSYAFAVLWSFGGPNDGDAPLGGVVRSPNGVLYGTTEDGGASGQGTVFSLQPSGNTYTEKTLHVFSGAEDGNGPYAGLSVRGNMLYGTTQYGGGSGCGGPGCGIVFKITTTGTRYSVLHVFQGGSDGATPEAGVIAGKNSILYGTTVAGGACGGAGCGTVFAVTP